MTKMTVLVVRYQYRGLVGCNLFRRTEYGSSQSNSSTNRPALFSSVLSSSFIITVAVIVVVIVIVTVTVAVAVAVTVTVTVTVTVIVTVIVADAVAVTVTVTVTSLSLSLSLSFNPLSNAVIAVVVHIASCDRKT